MSLFKDIQIIFSKDAFNAAVGDAVTAYKGAAKQAVTTTTAKATKAMQEATSSAGLGKLGKAWQSKVYPTGEALSPSGLIYVAGDRSAGAIRAYAEGATIRPKNGHRYIAIPLPAAGKRATPEKMKARGVTLDFVPARGRRPAMLVAKGNFGKTNKFRKATARQAKSGNTASVPMFLLIPQASINARFSIDGVLKPFGGVLSEEFVRLVERVSKSTEYNY